MPNLTLGQRANDHADQLIVELVTPPDAPAVILVRWPAAVSVARPDDFDNLVAAVYRILADARTARPGCGGERRTQ